MNEYAMHRRAIKLLEDLPVGTTIYFLQNGKERYLRKIRPTAAYPHPWYSMEYGTSIPDNKVPSGWSVMYLGQANNNAQRRKPKCEKYRANYRY